MEHQQETIGTLTQRCGMLEVDQTLLLELSGGMLETQTAQNRLNEETVALNRSMVAQLGRLAGRIDGHCHLLIIAGVLIAALFFWTVRDGIQLKRNTEAQQQLEQRITELEKVGFTAEAQRTQRKTGE
jgi:hypothetical protein